MPELPEVETICIGLRNGSDGQPSILGRRIDRACVLWERTIQAPTISELHQNLGSQEIRDISRRGKYILMHLDRSFLIIHLRMSGDLFFRANCQPIAPHDRILFEFLGGGCLVFNDTRKFGRIWLVQDPGDVLGKLGPEPFDPDLTGETFYKMLLGHNTPIKKLLLDQSFIAGIGNIYADEGLFGAKIHPLTISSQINIDSAEFLLSSLRMVLQEGIRHHGSSIDWVYKGGDFQNYFRVYKRTGLPCRQCGTPIERILVGQRSTHYCPNCQHLLQV
jgi:formamidopyrimidine-DNA glycosylase